jgi:hypothetical protein
MIRLRERFGYTLSIRLLFRTPLLRQFSRVRTKLSRKWVLGLTPTVYLQLTSRGCMTALTFCGLLLAVVSRAGEPALYIPLQRDTPLAQLIALATRSEEANSGKGYDSARCEALSLLAQQPKVPPRREKAIKEALLAALSARQPQVRNGGAAALARRGYRSESARLFSQLDTDPEPLAHFYRAIESPEKDPPIARLRRGLRSTKPRARAVIAEIVGLCRVKAMAGELERSMDAETDAEARDQLAIALTLLGGRDSKDALLRLRRSGYHSLSLARALIELGGAEHIREMLGMLWHSDSELRSFIAASLTKISGRDRDTAIDLLLMKLRDSSPKVRIQAARALAYFRAPQAIPILQETLPDARSYSTAERAALVLAVADFGEELAIPLLNTMLQWRFREECGLEAKLADFGHPSSGVAAWNAYADDLKKVTHGGYLVDEYRKALPVVAACADAELLTIIRDAAAAIEKPDIKGRLQGLIGEIMERLAQEQSGHRPLPRPLASAPIPVDLRDSDGDGVPDVRDKYPSDNRRVEDIPVHRITFPEKRYALVPMRAFVMNTPEPQFLTIDDDSRVAYLTEEIVDDAPAFRIASGDGFGQTQEWILPNPGTLPGVEKLLPAAMLGDGTLIGTALWKPAAATASGAAGDSRLQPGSGFIFKAGKLTIDPAAPLSAGALRSTYKRIDLHGRIFGHREERPSEAVDAPTRTTAFFGKHVFRDVPPFEVAAITRNGSLLCYRETTTGRENFIWNGTRFIPIRANADAPAAFGALPMKVVDMNTKLQVIGQLEQTGRPSIAFLWENDTVRPLLALIPQEYSLYLQNIVPLFISDSGEITFTAALLSDPLKPLRPQTFGLTLRKSGENRLELKRVE